MPLTGAAAVRLYDDHVDAVHALVTRRVGPDASPDIAAEAFEHAMRTWDRFDRERGTERLFMFGAAVAVLRRHDDLERLHLRSLRAAPTAEPTLIADPLVPGGGPSVRRVVAHSANDDILGDVGSDEPGSGAAGSDKSGGENSAAAPSSDRRKPAPAVDVDDEVGRTMRAVADLAPDDRDILLLSLWESCPQSDIAQALDMTVGTVRSALGRIRRDLKVAAGDAPTGRRRRR